MSVGMLAITISLICDAFVGIVVFIDIYKRKKINPNCLKFYLFKFYNRYN